ncbi:hypothetical protein [Nostoc sp. LPT]|uniref:hypothetical protein n=1 Tax=Nostoc sp. LPT TaxID=2815387 RepID=UPI001E11585A|nr:hypothetical protein [Nostoc sp. LPT]MBN4005422.1 hypothetical protein [Nostoc sp. LPT]
MRSTNLLFLSVGAGVRSHDINESTVFICWCWCAIAISSVTLVYFSRHTFSKSITLFFGRIKTNLL